MNAADDTRPVHRARMSPAAGMNEVKDSVVRIHPLDGAGALGASLAKLLDATGLGIAQLDGRGRIVAVNERARQLLRTGDGLFDKGGFLHESTPEDDAGV